MIYNGVDYTYKIENDLVEATVGNNAEDLQMAAWGFAENLHLWYRIDDFGAFTKNYVPDEYYNSEEDYKPLIQSSVFDELNATTLYQSKGCIFRERSEFADLKDYIDYIKQFPIKMLRVTYYNTYTIKKDDINFEIKLHDEENSVYVFKEYLSFYIEYYGKENLTDQLNVAFDLGKDSDEQCLANMFKVLRSKGYSINEVIPEGVSQGYSNSLDDSYPEYLSEDDMQGNKEFESIEWFEDDFLFGDSKEEKLNDNEI